NLRHFDGMSEPVAEVIGEAAGKDLSLCLQAAKSARVDDAVAVPLEIIAIGMLGLGNTAAAGLLHPHGVIGQHGGSLALRGEHSAISIQHSALSKVAWPSRRRAGGHLLPQSRQTIGRTVSSEC